MYVLNSFQNVNNSETTHTRNDYNLLISLVHSIQPLFFLTFHRSYIRLVVKRPSVRKRTIDNCTQTKFFNHKSSLIVPKQDHRFKRFDPKTRSYLSHKLIPRGLSVCQTPNHVTTTFPIFCRVPVPSSCIPCHFLSFERNKFGPFFQYSNDRSCVKIPPQQTKFPVTSARFA